MSGWRSDLAIGVRLAVGGGRTSMARFILSALGVGIAVVVLLMAASVGTISGNRDDRSAALSPDSNPIEGVAPTLLVWDSTTFRGEHIRVQRVRATGPTSPLPPGVVRMPAADELVVSPAFVDLLADSDSKLLAPRFPQRIIGTLDPSVVPDPYDLIVYIGLLPDRTEQAIEVYRFGLPMERSIAPGLLLVLLLGVAALLVPVFIFIAASTRIAGAERDRRLSALRLVGAGSRQVRRIAAAETLVGALAGVVVGALGYLLLRPLVSSVRLLGVGIYPSDVVPNWWLVGVIAVAVPALAVLTAQTALRRTIIEPLGVVRFSRPVRRRVLWRLALVAAGVGLLLWNGGGDSASDLWAYSIATGATLMLIGVPVLLPVVVERVVIRLRGGPPSWQLAVRRLQLDSGTSARVIGGVAVVLAGAIALQALLLTQATRVGLPSEPTSQAEPSARAWADPQEAAVIADVIEAVDGVQWIARFTPTDLATDLTSSERVVSVYVATCGDIEKTYRVVDCVDGDVFETEGAALASQGFTPGQRLHSMAWDGSSGAPRTLGEWVMPADLRPLPSSDPTDSRWGIIATPAAAPPISPTAGVSMDIRLDPAKPDTIELLRNATFGTLTTDVYLPGDMRSLTDEQETFLTIRRGLLIGSIFTLMLAGVSLLVLAVEHIRERRRPLAVLAASGVPTGSIARSLLWQIGVPIGLGVGVAVGTGVALAALVVRLSTGDLLIDWPGVAVMSAAAVLLGLLVCLVTLPFLRSATRVESLRTE